MTKLLYMNDFDVEACEAKIVALSPTVDSRVEIILDQTCFYARGGGQDWDTGTIRKPGGTFAVEEVRLDDAGNVHHIGVVCAGDFSDGDDVFCEVDHERRTINMRLHSAAHVIDMAVDDLGLDWIATKGQHYPHLSAVEYSGTWDSNRGEELRAKIEECANLLISKGSNNSMRFMPVAEMHTICRHVPANIPRNKAGRVVVYGEDFGIPCGGTHVRDIRQVGRVTIPKIRQKKNVIRVNYLVDGISAY